jgi:hypothetical protein
MAWLLTRRELERGKHFLRNRDFDAARNAVAWANRVRPRLKHRAILMALRVAPSWLHRLDRARHRPLTPSSI